MIWTVLNQTEYYGGEMPDHRIRLYIVISNEQQKQTFHIRSYEILDNNMANLSDSWPPLVPAEQGTMCEVVLFHPPAAGRTVYPTVSSNIASWKFVYKWRFIAGKLIEFNGGFSVAMFAVTLVLIQVCTLELTGVYFDHSRVVGGPQGVGSPFCR